MPPPVDPAPTVPAPPRATAGAVQAATVRDHLARGAALLARAGCETPRLDAELLLAAALGVDRARLVIDARLPVPEDAVRHYRSLLDRRAAREPVAYILGRRQFRWLTLHVDSRVLIPRPETELLVEFAVGGLHRGARVADVGTGSGAIALALKHERPDLEVLGIDMSAEALAVADGNAERLGLDVMFRAGDLLDGTAAGELDAVIANLPYVPDGMTLQPEIARYEPAAALFAGPDGLDAIRRLCGMLDGVPLVALEHGEGQGAAVQELLRDAGLHETEHLRDLAGRERVVVGRR